MKNNDGYTIEFCPHCGVDVCNGMGPATMPIVTKILDKFPMAKLFYRECCMHDMDFHLQKGFKKSNKYFGKRMKAKLKTVKFDGGFVRRFLKRQWYRFLIPRIVWFVSGKSGREAYDEGKCIKLPERLVCK